MDFKSLRSDKLKLTQEEFANLYGISIQEVQELDKTGKPDMDLIVKIATKSGLDFNTILSYEKPRVKPINAKDTWEKTNFTKKSLSGYLNSALEQMDIPDDMRKNYIDDLEIGIMSKFVKPTVAIVGRSDTGKSTLINSLIGAEKMPAKWTPTTSTAVYVKHIKDRPAFIHDEAWIFKRECGNEKFWNSKRLYDEKYCEKWKVAGGDLSLLETYSTRQGGGLKTEAGSAVVFVDAPILLNCDIIDLPGYGTETASDDVITAKTAAHADVLIYLSLASGFLRIEDIEYLKNNVRTLPVLEKKGENGLKPLANLFVVASHADSVDNGNEISLANILKSGCERYMSTLSDSYWKSRAEESGYDYSPAVIQSRFFTYTTDIPALCEKFRNNLDVTIKRSDAPRATVPEENGRASADIKYGDEQASLKFCKDAESSAMNQTNPGYGDQHRIVPSDQLDDAKDVLTGSAQKNRLRGREDAAAQQEKTRDLLDDRIRGKDGTESTPLTKKQDDDLSKTIKKDENGNAYVDNEAMDKVMEDTGIKGKVKNAIRKNEIQGLASAVAIGAGIGFTIGFAVSLAQSGITPDSVKYAFVNGGKSGVASGVQSVVGYGIGRTIGQIATNAIEGVLSNAGLEITANISKMCTMGTVGAITVAVFSTVQFVKLIYHGECLKSAAIQVGKQALFSLSLLAISIAAQGMWGGPAGIIVSIGTGIVIVSYTIADAVHQRTFAEECHIKTIEEYGRLALRHLNELQFA